jgi:hypothetical protein
MREAISMTSTDQLPQCPTGRVGVSEFRASAQVRTCIWRSWRRRSDWIPAKIGWVVPPERKAVDLFAGRKVDAFLGFPPEPQELLAGKIGRMILSTTTDKPWSNLFLLHGVWRHGLRPRSSGRHQTLPPGPPQDDRPLRHRTRAGRARSDPCRLHAALRLRPPDTDRSPVRPLARVRRRGLAALLRASAPRGRDD